MTERQRTREEIELEEAIIAAAQRLAGQGNPLLGRHVSAVQRTLTDVCLTDGHVDLGDGVMTAFDAACQLDVIETIKRGLQYRADAAKKNGWSSMVCTTLDGMFRDLRLLYPGVDVHRKIEIKLRIVEGETS